MLENLTPERVFGERIAARITVDPGGCWRWQGATTDKGYGHVWDPLAKRMRYLHQLALEWVLGGPIPKGLQPAHICTPVVHRDCCHPLHVRLRTNRANTLEGDSPNAILHRRNRCAKGHSLLGGNAYVRSNGTRQCRACENDRKRRKRAHGRSN